MKKVLFLINTLGIGGAELALINLVNSLNPEKFDITIITITNHLEFAYKLNPSIRLINSISKSKNIFWNKICNKILYLKMKYCSPLYLYKSLVKDFYDIEVGFLEGLPTKIISASNSKAKKIAWVHTNLDQNRDSDYFFKSDLDQEQAYKKFNEIYCVSQSAKDAFIKRFKINESIYIINNIINEKEILKLSTKKVEASFSRGINFITVGRLTAQKGYIRLINAYANAIQKTTKKTHLYIIGDGSEKDLMVDTINKLKINNYITLLGSQENPYKYINRADVYLCGSIIEGFSLAIIEALILGKPVLTTKVANVQQLLNDGKFGLIVENNIDGLEYGIIKLIENAPDLNKYKKNIKKLFINEYSNIEAIENQILKW